MKIKLTDWASTKLGFGAKINLEFETKKLPPRYDLAQRKNWIDFPVDIDINKPFEAGEITKDMFIDVPTKKGTRKLFFGLFEFEYKQ